MTIYGDSRKNDVKMMKNMKKIMFNDKYGLTDAVLAGRKTMTRRIVTPKQEKWLRFIDGEPSEWIRHGARFLHGEDIAVAQNYKDCIGQEYLDYVAEDEVCKLVMNGHIGCTNKMFVRADLMPHRIRIKNIKVERLQDISDVDCRKEGIIHVNWRQYLKQDVYDFTPQKYKEHSLWTLPIFEESFLDSWAEKKPGEYAAESAKVAFAVLIDKISGKGAWNRNPWVFAYEFELLR